MLEKALVAYKLWHGYHADFPRLSKFSLGTKIDTLFTDLIACILLSGYTPRPEKLHRVEDASTKLDLLKFFTQVAWELRCLDHKQYAALVTPLGEIGKMIGGWQRQLQTKQPSPEGDSR